MAYSFVAASSQSLSATHGAIVPPLAIGAIFINASTALSQGVVSLHDSTVAAQRFMLNLRGDQVGDPVRYIVQSGLTAQTQTGTFDAGLHTVLGFSSDLTNIGLFFDGAKVTAAQTVDPITVDQITAGRFGGTTPSSFMDGDISYVFVLDAVPTDQQAAELAAFRHPRNVFGPEMVDLWTFQTDGALTSEGGGVVLALTNAPVWAANPCRIWTGSTATGTDGAAFSIEGFGFNDVQGVGKLELVDNAVYASGTKVAQTVSAWDDAGVSGTYSLGGLTAGSLFLFATNSGGELSQAFPVTISAASTPEVGVGMSNQLVALTGSTDFFLPPGTYYGARLTGDATNPGTLQITDEATGAVLDELRVTATETSGKRPLARGVRNYGQLKINPTTVGRAVVWYEARGAEGEGGGFIANPSFEVNTTGWTAGGTNTIVRSTEEAKFGSASAKCTFGNAIAMAEAAITLPAAGAYEFSVWAKIPAAWNGNLIAGFNLFVGSTVDNVAFDLGIRDEWQQVASTVTVVAGDLAGVVRVFDTVAPTAGRFVYVDGANLRPA